ncbi:MAG TPA: hypothetical protein VMX54_06780 [Vicinamibacteria bacterium]|nr:hypothetical protein [Vicinamibacteria bacterium]
MRVPVTLCCALCATLMVSCCGEGQKAKGEESLARRAGSKVGETWTQFASGVGAGVALTVPVELSEELRDRGLTKTVARSLGGDARGKGFTVYLIAAKALTGDLVARAFDKEGQEIGRTRVRIELAADDAKYVTFSFDPEMDANLVAKYAISLSRRGAMAEAR